MRPLVPPSSLSFLLDSQNLLGFSAGVDSVALFFLLLESKIPFDIAIVHYHTRAQADEEVGYARELAARYGKRCFVAHAPHFAGDFERRAREFRMSFFESLIARYGYTRLLLAHQLNDRLEWLLMRLTQGSGLGNLLGFEESREAGGFAHYDFMEDIWHGELARHDVSPADSARAELLPESPLYMESSEDSKTYEIIRPLRALPKAMLRDYCERRGARYFEDSSNADMRILRNYFRHSFCERLIEEFGSGIARSLELLELDAQSLRALTRQQILPLPHLLSQARQAHNAHKACASQDSKDSQISKAVELRARDFRIYALEMSQYDENALLLGCDKVFKQCGYVLSGAQRSEIAKSGFNCQIARVVVACNGLDSARNSGLAEQAGGADEAGEVRAGETSGAGNAGQNLGRVKVFIAPFLFDMYQSVTHQPLPKDFKHFCAQNAVPPKLRSTIYAEFSAWFRESCKQDMDAFHQLAKQEKASLFERFGAKIRNFFTL